MSNVYSICFGLAASDKGSDLIDQLSGVAVTVLEFMDAEENIFFVHSAAGVGKRFDIFSEAVEDAAPALATEFSAKVGKSFPPELLQGLAVCACDQDEDGLYDYVQANGGKAILADDPTWQKKYAGLPFSMVTRYIDVDVVIAGDTVTVNGDDTVPLSEAYGYLDDGADSFAFYKGKPGAK